MYDTLVSDRKNLHETRIQLIHGLRRLRFMRNEIKPPKQIQKLIGKQAISAPLAFRHVQTVVGAIAKNRPTPMMLMRDPADIERMGRGQKFFDFCLQQMERIAQKQLYWKWVDNVVADGLGFWKITRHAWQDYPEPKEDETDEAYLKRVDDFLYSRPPLPFRLRVVEPHTVFFPTYEWEPKDMLEISTRSLRDALTELRIAPVNGSLSTMRLLEVGEPFPRDEVPNIQRSSVEVSEFWSEDKVAFGLLGQWFEMDNPYNGKIPYVKTGGATTGSSDPALEHISTLYPFQRLQPWLDMMVTSLIAWSMTVTNPIVYTTRKPGMGVTGTTETAIQEIPWGKHMDLGLGGEIGTMAVPDVGQSVKGSIELITEMLDRSSLSPAASGFMGTRTAGLAIASAVENSLAMFSTTVDNMKIGMSELYKLISRFIDEDIGVNVYATGFNITEGKGKRQQVGTIQWGPEDVNATLDILCDIKKEGLQDLIAKGTHAAFMRDKGLWDEEMSMLFAGVEDVDRVRKNKLKDMARQHPIVQQYLAMAAVSEEPPLAMLYQQAMGMGDTGQSTGGETPVEGQEGASSGGGGAPAAQGPSPKRGGTPKGKATATPRGSGRQNPSAGRRS
jgi:hypothetical protein